MDVFEACRTGNLDWLKQQKKAGTLLDLLSPNSNGWYPHELAAKNGHLDVIKWLVLESGQSVDVTADDNSAVRYAAQNGHLDVVKWLVNLSAEARVEESGQTVDVTACDNYAVQLAAANGHLDVVRWLVEESGQPIDVTADNNSALRHAASNGHTRVVDYLNFVTPLIQAVGLNICRNVGFDAISDMLTTQATSKSTTRRL